jgi:bifunctional non-homologous end joining protein LigD
MLPQIAPMLATAARPFDHPDYAFEIKWNGVRALAAVEADGWRLWGRRGADYTVRYPDLGCLRRLPPGTLLDGELVVFTAGRPDLAMLLRRHHLLDPCRIRAAARWAPVRYILFDLLYHRGRSWMTEPWQRRRNLLADLYAEWAEPTAMLSEAVVGQGRALYQAVLAQGFEGVMAKHLAAPYRPGRRSLAWRKIKPPHSLTRKRSIP